MRKMNCALQWIESYSMDSIIHLLNNWDQVIVWQMELTISKVTLSIKEESVFWVHLFAYSQICWKNFGWRYCCQTVASWKRLVRFVSLILPLRVIRMLFFFIRTILIIQTHRVPDPIYRCFPDQLERLLVPCLVFSLWICHSFCCVNYFKKLRDWAYDIYLGKINQKALCSPKWNSISRKSDIFQLNSFWKPNQTKLAGHSQCTRKFKWINQDPWSKHR